jgi:hypothetical protein
LKNVGGGQKIKERFSGGRGKRRNRKMKPMKGEMMREESEAVGHLFPSLRLVRIDGRGRGVL